MYTLLFRRLSMFITIIFAASLMIFVTGVFAQSATPTPETEITGVLESITSGSIVVSGQTISIVGAEVKNILVVGSTVTVHVSTVNSTLTAREVQTVVSTDDNTNANANSNLNGNTNDNTNVNANSNTNSNANDNIDDNSNDNTGVAPTVTAQQAIDIVLAVYPTTNILSVELTSKFGGTLVWEVKIRNGIELNIDAQAATILTIDRRGDNNDQSGNANGNSNDNRDDHGNSNDNRDDHGNDNNDDNGNDNNDDHDDHGNDNNDDHDGNSGSDSGNSGSDDNGGMG